MNAAVNELPILENVFYRYRAPPWVASEMGRWVRLNGRGDGAMSGLQDLHGMYSQRICTFDMNNTGKGRSKVGRQIQKRGDARFKNSEDGNFVLHMRAELWRTRWADR